MGTQHGGYRRMLSFCLSLILLVCIFNANGAHAQQNAKCSKSSPCHVGCCSKEGVCGFTKAHCGDGCQSNCNAKAECGQYALKENFDCPINVCCSQYGFCGTTEEFCGDGCQKNSDGGGCGSVSPPKTCDVNTDALSYKRRIGYYELFTQDRACGTKEPEELPIEAFTHINLAFINFDSDFKLVPEHDDWVKRTVLRKLEHPSLRINVAIGGWAFNDPPTSTYFSDMVHSYEGRATWIKSVTDFIRHYGLDGVDVDWEYPTAGDRGGKEGDAGLLNQVLAELREAFDAEGTDWEISMTIPTSYWYMKGFDMENLQDKVDYFNFMTYDIHGMWDFDNEFTGPYLQGHTDWREIDKGLDLLWRNKIKPEKVVMGFAFYGRSFTMADSSCHQPNGICKFATGGMPGTCSNQAGILTFEEIKSRNKTLDAVTYYDPKSTVKYTVFGGDQWISYDDAQSFHDKLVGLSKHCLSGLMIWAIDQDTAEYDALGALLGDYSGLELEGADSDSKEKLHDLFGQFNGQDCFVTPRCTDGSDKEQGDQQVCPSGYMTVDTAHDPEQKFPHKRYGDCAKGWYRRICCPSNAMPKSCEWKGAPERNVIGCSQGCGEGTFELASDTALNAKGTGICGYGRRSLCCQSTKLMDDCFWNDCQGPLFPLEEPTCPKGYKWTATRFNKPGDKGLCRETYGDHGSPLKEPFKSALCCPTEQAWENCAWSTDGTKEYPGVSAGLLTQEDVCYPNACKKDQVQLSEALNPTPDRGLNYGRYQISCDGISFGPGVDPHVPLCCDPPTRWNKHWPVDPAKLWEQHFDNPKTDKALWDYEDRYTQNDKDSDRSSKEDGTDAYGFLMLNGKKEALDENFGKTHTVVRRSKRIPNVKKSIITSNHTIIDNVFEHTEETFYVYCNHPPGSPECEEVWDGGVDDTVVRLPEHVGEGPFARIVSMEPAADDYSLPKHHLEHRSMDGLHENPIYKVKIDYNFHEVRADRGPVKIRIDYTNLLHYWEQLTDEKDAKASRVKRGMPNVDEPWNLHSFRDRVNRAEAVEKKLGRRSSHVVKAHMPLGVVPSDEDAKRLDVRSQDGVIQKRWWGLFKDWLKRLTTVRKGELGDLPLDYGKEINIFNAKWGCVGQTFQANLRMDLQAHFTMQAQYAYYYSATFIPPEKPDVFVYFGTEPEAELMLKLEGNARLKWESDLKKLIDTLGYPGLAVKGIAAVGPTLDIFGQVKGEINIHGEAKAGTTIKFDKSQVFWPQSDKAIEEFDNYFDIGLKEGQPKKPSAPEVAPTFEAGVQLRASLDVIVQPEANVGIKVGGSKLTGGRSLVDAQVTAFLRAALRFLATGSADTTSKVFNYKYGAYVYYNLGYKAKAVLLEWKDWALDPRMAYTKDQKITIYEDKGKIPLGSSNEKRMIRLIDPALDHPDFKIDNATMSTNDVMDPSRLFRRADDDDANADPNAPQLTHKITCPAGSKADVTIPELRFSCGAFPPVTITNPDGTTQTFKDMCKGYKSVQGLPMTLTHCPSLEISKLESWLNKKRSKQCPDGFCKAETDKLRNAYYTGPKPDRMMTLECDEYPWASSEEGGDFKPSASRSQTCVPSFQNGLGGNCIAMMSLIQQNVGKMDPGIPSKDQKDEWIYWGGSKNPNTDFWYKNDTTKGNVRQRFTRYDETQPIPCGFSEIDPRPAPFTNKDSWMFRRNYTFSIVDDGAPASAWWDATAKAFNNPSGKKFSSPNDYASIICAVNTFDQSTYYKEPKQSSSPSFNALCETDKKRTQNGFPDQWRTTRCKLDFGKGSTKRSEGGAFGGWDITGVTLFDDDIDMSDPHALEKLIDAESQEATNVVVEGETTLANQSANVESG